MPINISRLLFTLLFILSSHAGLTQNTVNKRPNQIFISPARVLDLANPGIEIGYQRAYGKNLATLVSVARMTDLFYRVIPGNGNFELDNYTGWRFQAEQKYFIKQKKNVRMYLAADLMLLKANYDYSGSFTTDTLEAPYRYTENYYTDDYHTDKTNFSVNIKYGIQFPVGHFVFDFVGGIGAKYRSVTRTGLINPDATELKSRHPNFWEATNKPGKAIVLSLPINIRVAYEF